MPATATTEASTLAPFSNEPYLDFTQQVNADAARAALAKVQSEFGKEYSLLIGGEERRSESKLRSLNPSFPKEVVGLHQNGTRQDALDAIERAFDFFPAWAATP